MANALNVKIGGDIAGLQKALSKATGAIRNAGQRMSDVGKTMSTRVTAPLVALGGVAVNQAAKFETLRVAMDTLNGSVEEGGRNFERLKRFSAETPFQLDDLAKAQNMLQGFGQSADDAFNSIQMIGDIAAISGGSIQGIGVAFGQAAAEGRVMTQDIRQFINQGVPAIKMLADTMGVAESEILDLASQGEISFEILQRSFREATQEGGMFADGMEKQSQTISGRMSTMKDNISIAMAEVGKLIVDALEPFTDRLQDIAKGLGQVNPATVKLGLAIAGVVAAIGPLLIVLGTLTKALALVMTPIFAKIAAIMAIVGAITYVSKNLKAFSEFFQRRFIMIKNSVVLQVAGMIEALDHFISYLPGVEAPLEGVKNAVLGMITELPEVKHEFQSAGEFIKDIVSDLSDQFQRLSSYIFPSDTVDKPKDFGANIQRASLPVREFGTTLRSANSAGGGLGATMDRLGKKINNQTQITAFATSIADNFTNSFGQGMANVVVQGEKLVDTLKNIGRLLASAVIQKGLSTLLTGGLGGSGFFGSGGGLFGKIFGVDDALITSGGDVVKFNSADDILASKNMDQVIGGGAMSGRIEVFGTLKGQDLFISSNRGGNTYDR